MELSLGDSQSRHGRKYQLNDRQRGRESESGLAIRGLLTGSLVPYEYPDLEEDSATTNVDLFRGFKTAKTTRM